MSYPNFTFCCLSFSYWYVRILYNLALCSNNKLLTQIQRTIWSLILPHFTLGLCHTPPLLLTIPLPQAFQDPDFSPARLFFMSSASSSPAPLYYCMSLCIHPSGKVIHNLLSEYKFQLLHYTFLFQFTLIFSFSKTLQLIWWTQISIYVTRIRKVDTAEE